MRVVVRPRPSGAQHTSHGLFWGNGSDSMRLFAGLLTSGETRDELQALSRHNLRDHSPDSLSLCLLLAVCRRIGQCLSKQQQCLEQSTAGANSILAIITCLLFTGQGSAYTLVRPLFPGKLQRHIVAVKVQLLLISQGSLCSFAVRHDSRLQTHCPPRIRAVSPDVVGTHPVGAQTFMKGLVLLDICKKSSGMLHKGRDTSLARIRATTHVPPGPMWAVQTPAYPELGH